MAGLVQSPEKELRFTRSGQAVVFGVAAAILAGVAVTLVATAFYREINPEVPHGGWALLPLVLAVLAGRVAIHLTRHAYLILTPLGIEIFPFFRPSRGMQLISWQEIACVEVSEDLKQLTLHYDEARSGGIHLSLKPIRADRRCLLAKAVQGRLSPGGPTG